MKEQTVTDAFEEVYTKFKLHFYREIFGLFSRREASLTTVESFCMEVIHAMGCPTVNEFASFIRISPPNAAYKINNLIKKGYIQKIRSKKDRREYYLKPTQKYLDYYNVSSRYLLKVLQRMTNRFSKEDQEKLHEILNIMSEELMPEVPAYKHMPKELMADAQAKEAKTQEAKEAKAPKTPHTPESEIVPWDSIE